jgi:phosphomethylpyrimidine synthase
MTILETVRAGRVPEAVEEAAKAEGVSPEVLAEAIARGETIVCRNRLRTHCRPLAIGRGLRTKVNANIGTSKDQPDLERELAKLDAALKSGADTVMDLSTGGPLVEIRRRILDASPVPVGTVPIYEAAVAAAENEGRTLLGMTADEIFRVIEAQAREGVDFMTVHCGITRQGAARLAAHPRILGVVSRGGSFLVAWMRHNGAENPLYEEFDRLLSLCRDFDVVLSLGDGFRPGALADATDRGQIQELLVLGELTLRAWEAGVQVMIEGPGHVPLDQIAANVLLQKRLCHGAPFYVLGPLVTDVAPGYDHITGAIGGAIAAMAGADILCYVTPSEHLGLPDVEDVRTGVIASRIAGHAADVAKGVPGARQWDDAMARARAALDWRGQADLAIDPERARAVRGRCLPADADVCTMCGEFCAIKVQRSAGEAGCRGGPPR